MSVDLIFEHPEYLFDLRVRERNIVAGVITAKQVQEYLDALADDEEAGEMVDLPKMEATEGLAELGKRNKSEVEDGQEELLTEEL
jgi:hypothetical protein